MTKNESAGSVSPPLRTHDHNLRLLRFPEVRARTGLSRSTIWRLQQRGKFPKHRQISSNAVAWLEHEVDGWIRRVGSD